MEHTQDANDAAHGGLSRRRLLRSAALGGAVAWTAPVVATLNSPASAAGAGSFPGTGFSELAMVLRKGTTYYRVKYEFEDNAFKAATSAKEPVDESCGGKVFPRQQLYVAPSAYRFPGTSVLVPDRTYREGRPFRAALASGVSLVAYFVHQGSCCAFYESRVPGHVPTPAQLPTTYVGCTIDYVVTSETTSQGTLVTFPPAFNACGNAC